MNRAAELNLAGTTRNAGKSAVATAKSGRIGSPLSQKETAQYLAEMILELRNLAKAAQLYQVMVPLEYAYYEAFGIANKVEVPEAEVERLKELAKIGAENDPIPDDY